MKSQFTAEFTWFTSMPSLPSVPQPVQGTKAGNMAVNLFSNIIDVTLLDNMGLELTWTGNPGGTFSVMGSSSGVNFYALTFSPTLQTAGGAPGGFLIDLNQFPWKYLQIQYASDSVAGSLVSFLTAKDLS